MNNRDGRGILFSKDRAMQLDATLRSFWLHCQDAAYLPLMVLYKTTTAQHARQYTRLAEQFEPSRWVRFIPQKDFWRDALRLLQPKPAPGEPAWLYRLSFAIGPRLGSILGRSVPKLSLPGYVLFLVDDNLFVRGFRLEKAAQALENKSEALAFSLRLGTNTIYCYALDKPQPLPVFSSSPGEVLEYDWTQSYLDFGYPLEVSSSLYRRDVIVPLLRRTAFKNPNVLEARIAAQVKDYRLTHPKLLCFEQSVTFCNPINKVQQVFDNRAGTEQEYSNQKLADLFDEGFRIRVEEYSGLIPNGCHQEVPLSFERVKTVPQYA